MPARLIDLLTLVTVAIAAPDAAGASDAPVARAAPAATIDAAPITREVDETALRYYAATRQAARVEAETRRLRRLHPTWTPPADLWASHLANGDESELWDLLAADKLDDLQKAIAQRQTRESNWRPSSDLESKLRRKQARAAILADGGAQRWDEIARTADRSRNRADFGDVDVQWLIAEAYSRGRRAGDCKKVLESILLDSIEPQERIATIHKALALLPMRDAEDLIKSGKVDSTGASEFDVIAIDITRARISAILHDAPGNDVTTAEMASFRAYAEKADDPDQIALLAWYALKRNELRDALDSFKASMVKGGDAVVAHGLAHTLKRLGRLRDAEEVAYAWREPSSANTILYVDILAEQLTVPATVIEPQRVARYAEVALRNESGEAAQALGWYAYNACQMQAASEWFRRAMAWFPKQTTTYGYALSVRRLKRQQEFLEIVNRYDGLFPMTVSLLFPDETTRDDPCERDATGSLRAAGSRSLAMPVAARTQAGRVPMPQDLGIDRTRGNVLPKASEFPILVSMENPYRSQPKLAPDSRQITAGWRRGAPFAASTSARRVPGVAPMPYERYGVTLSPAWNGATEPAASDDARLRSPRGTTWALPLPDDNRPDGHHAARDATAATRFQP